MELPDAITTPMPKRFLPDWAREEDVFFLVRTGTRIDTGGWFGKGKVWALARAHDLLLHAAGATPYMEAVPYAELAESLYNHVSGEFVLAPVQEVQVKTLKMTPLDASQLLAQILKNG